MEDYKKLYSSNDYCYKSVEGKAIALSIDENLKMLDAIEYVLQDLIHNNKIKFVKELAKQKGLLATNIFNQVKGKVEFNPEVNLYQLNIYFEQDKENK